jgi:hypothetical protein
MTAHVFRTIETMKKKPPAASCKFQFNLNGFCNNCSLTNCCVISWQLTFEKQQSSLEITICHLGDSVLGEVTMSDYDINQFSDGIFYPSIFLDTFTVCMYVCVCVCVCVCSKIAEFCIETQKLLYCLKQRKFPIDFAFMKDTVSCTAVIRAVKRL